MKIALLNDTHFGARNDSIIFDDYFHKFYDEIFFPYLKEHNIKTLIHKVHAQVVYRKCKKSMFIKGTS